MAEEQAWVFDSLVCFLHGPIWNAPIQNFIEEKSIIFDPNMHDETNKEYKKLHEEYKNLVDFMLGSFMEELQITTEQFEVACLESRNQNDSLGAEAKQQERSFSFHHGLFQQIWAANDLQIFIKMMVKRNLEIQIQALDLLERQASCNQSNDESILKEDVPNESLYNNGEIPDEIKLLGENAKGIKAVNTSQESIKSSVSKGISGNLLEENMLDRLEDDDMDEKFKRLHLFFKNEKVDSNEINQRQDYLRAQRDKLLNIKKQARARQLNETVCITGRPQSASVTAAKILLDVKKENQTATDSELVSSTQLRLTLAKRLRTEVIDGAEN